MNSLFVASLTMSAISDFDKGNNGYLDRLIKTYVSAIQYKTSGGTTTAGDIISNMGQYFKTISWTVSSNSEGELTGWYPNKVSIQGSILYAIFVVQSLMFFIAYIKRFFYVIILAIMAPFIVIYDFLGKTLA